MNLNDVTSPRTAEFAAPAHAGGESIAADRTQTDDRLAELWREVLDCGEVRPQDNFFDLGGDSLAATKLMRRIQEIFLVELPVAVLLTQPTFGAMSGWIAQQQKAAPPAVMPACLMPLQSGRGRPALFCVHPAGGNPICYAALSEALGPEQPFYGCQPPGLMDGSASPMSVEQLAALYVDAARTVQPAGPYHLAGWSAGGPIVFEMARQLTQRREQVALLAFLDCDLMQMYAAHSKPVRVLKAFLVAMRLLSQVPLPRSYADARQLARMAGVRLPVAARSLFSRRAASQFAADAAYSVKLLRLIAWAAGDYRPRTFAGRAVLFRTGAAAHDPQDPMRRDLERFATGGVTVRPVPGTHMSMILDRRDVAALAAALREFLPAGPSAS